jgi:threonine dehydrogenase-like Zn-dependent dehydrogenase
VAAVDPLPARRAVALATGADLAIDPVADDAGLAIRRATGHVGVDVAIEASGAARGLHHALGHEAHRNRPVLVFPRAESEPHYDHPRWDERRQSDTAWDLLATGRLRCEEIVQPVVPFAEVVEAYRAIDERPESSIKLGVRFAEV